MPFLAEGFCIVAASQNSQARAIEAGALCFFVGPPAAGRDHRSPQSHPILFEPDSASSMAEIRFILRFFGPVPVLSKMLPGKSEELGYVALL